MAINPSIGQKLIRSVSDDADFSVSLQSPEEKHQEIAQTVVGRKTNEELIGQISSLQMEEASLQCENSQLEREFSS